MRADALSFGGSSSDVQTACGLHADLRLEPAPMLVPDDRRGFARPGRGGGSAEPAV